MVLSSVGKKLLASFLSDYVEGDYSVAVSLFGKHSVSLKHVEIKHEVLTELICTGSFPLRCTSCFIAELNVDIPLISLRSKPVRINVSDFFCVLQMEEESVWDAKAVEDACKSAHMAAMEAIWQRFLDGSALLKQQSAASYYFNGGTITRILDNVEISIQRFHVCIEGPPIDGRPNVGFRPNLNQAPPLQSRLHLRVEHAFMVTTDAQGHKHFDSDCDNIVFKHIKFSGLEVGLVPKGQSVHSTRFPSLQEKDFQAFLEAIEEAKNEEVVLMASVTVELRLRLNTAYALGPDDPARVHGTLACSPLKFSLDKRSLAIASYFLAQLSRFSSWAELVDHRRIRRMRKSIGWPATKQDVFTEFRGLCQSRLDAHSRRKKEEAGRKKRREELEAIFSRDQMVFELRAVALHLHGASSRASSAPIVVSTGIRDSTGPIQISDMERAGNRALFRASQDVSLERVVSRLRLQSEELGADEFEVQFQEEIEAIGLQIDADLRVHSCVPGSAADLSELIQPGLRVTAVQGLSTKGLSDADLQLLLRHSIRPISIRFKGSRSAAANANKFLAGRSVQMVDIEASAPSVLIELRGEPGSGHAWRIDVRGILLAAAVSAEANRLTISERLNAISHVVAKVVVCGLHASAGERMSNPEAELISSYKESDAELTPIRVNYPRGFASFSEWVKEAYDGAPLANRRAAGRVPMMETVVEISNASQPSPGLKVAGHLGRLLVNADVSAFDGLAQISQFVENFNEQPGVNPAQLPAYEKQADDQDSQQQYELQLDYTLYPLCLRIGSGRRGSSTLELKLDRVYLRNPEEGGTRAIATIDAAEAAILDTPPYEPHLRFSSDETEGFVDARSSIEEGRLVLAQLNSPVVSCDIRPSQLSLGLSLSSLSLAVSTAKISAIEGLSRELQEAVEKIAGGAGSAVRHPLASSDSVEPTTATALKPEEFFRRVKTDVESVLGVEVDASKPLEEYEVDAVAWSAILSKLQAMDPFETSPVPALTHLSQQNLSCRALARSAYELIYGLPFAAGVNDGESEGKSSDRSAYLAARRQTSYRASLPCRNVISLIAQRKYAVEEAVRVKLPPAAGRQISLEVQILDAQIVIFEALNLQLVGSSIELTISDVASSGCLSVSSVLLETLNSRQAVICRVDSHHATSQQPMVELRVDFGQTHALPVMSGLVKEVKEAVAAKEKEMLEGYTRQNPRNRPSRQVDRAHRRFQQHQRLGAVLEDLKAAQLEKPPVAGGPVGIKLGLIAPLIAGRDPSAAPKAPPEVMLWLGLSYVKLACTHEGNLALVEALHALSGDGTASFNDAKDLNDEDDESTAEATLPTLIAEVRIGVSLENVEISCEVEQYSKQVAILGMGLEFAYIGHQLVEHAAVAFSDLCVTTRAPGVTSRSLMKPFSGRANYELGRSDPLKWASLVRKISMKTENAAVALWTSDLALLSTLTDTLSKEAELFASPSTPTASQEPAPRSPAGQSCWAMTMGDVATLADTLGSAKALLVFESLLPFVWEAVETELRSVNDEMLGEIRSWMEESSSRVSETSIHLAPAVWLGIEEGPTAQDRVEVEVKGVELGVVKGILQAYTSGTFLPVVKLRCFDAFVRAESASVFVEDALLVARTGVEARFYNLRLETWEPLLEPINDLVLSVYKGPLAKAVNIDITALQRINLNLSEDALALHLSMTAELTRSDQAHVGPVHVSGGLNSSPDLQLQGPRNESNLPDSTPDYVLINQTGQSFELVDLFQIGCNRRGTLAIRAVDGWTLPSRTRWSSLPELELTLEPWGKRFSLGGGKECEVDYPGARETGFPSLSLRIHLPLAEDAENEQDKELLQGEVDLIPFVLMPGSSRKEWFSLRREDRRAGAVAEILLSISFHAAPEEAPPQQKAVEQKSIDASESVGVSFSAVSNERWFEETKPDEIIKHLADTGITTVRKAELGFPLTRVGEKRRRVFVPLDTTGKFIIAGEDGFQLPVTVGFRDDQRKTIVLHSPLLIKNNTEVDIEVRICTPLLRSADGEQRRHEDYENLRLISNKSAVLKASGNHLETVGLGLRGLFDHSAFSKWVDGGHSLQTITGANSWVQWEYDKPHKVCLYRIMPSTVHVAREHHAVPFRNPQGQLVDMGPNDLDADKLGVDPKGWTLMAKLDADDMTWEILDERRDVDFRDSSGNRTAKEFWVGAVGDFKVFRLDFHATDPVVVHEVEAWNEESVEAAMNLSSAAVGPHGTLPVALSSVELFEETLSALPPLPSRGAAGSFKRLFARPSLEEDEQEPLLVAREKSATDTLSVSSTNSRDTITSFSDSESSSRMLRHASRDSSVETWRCELCDEQNSRFNRCCKLCSSVHLDAGLPPSNSGSFTKAGRSVRERAKRLRDSATATGRAVSVPLPGVSGQKRRKLPARRTWRLADHAVVHAQWKRQQERCFLVLTATNLYIQSASLSGKEQLTSSKKSKARIVAVSAIKRIRDIEGLDTPGIELLVQLGKGALLSGSLRRAKSSGPRQSKIVLFFDEEPVRRRWTNELHMLVSTHTAAERRVGTSTEDIRVTVPPGGRYSVPLRFLLRPGGGAVASEVGSEEDRPIWALYVRKRSSNEDEFSWSSVVSNLASHSADALSERLIESIACASSDLPIIHSDQQEEDAADGGAEASTSGSTAALAAALSRATCSLFSLSGRVSEHCLPLYTLKGERVLRDSKVGSKFHLSLEPLVVVVNALPYTIKLQFFLGNVKLSVGFRSLEAGEKRAVCEVDERCLVRFRLSGGQPSGWSEKISVRAGTVQQESHLSELDSAVPLWPADAAQKSDSNRMCVLSLERFRDPAGPLKLTLFAPCWVYNFSDMPLLLKPTKAILSKLDIFNTYLPPNFTKTANPSRPTTLRPALESFSLGRNITLSGVLHESPPKKESEGRAAVTFGAGEEGAEQGWVRNWRPKEMDRVSGWSAPFKVTPGGELVHKEVVFRVGTQVVKRSVGIEMVSPKNAPFNRSIQLIIRTSFILVNRLPNRTLAFRQHRFKQQLLSVLRYNANDSADQADDVILPAEPSTRVPFHFNGLLRHRKFQVRAKGSNEEWSTNWSGSMSVLKETSTTLLLRSVRRSPDEADGAMRVRVLIREEGGATFVLFLPDVSDLHLRRIALFPEGLDPPFYSIRNQVGHFMEVRQTNVDTAQYGNIVIPPATFKPYGFDEPFKGMQVDIRALRPMTDEEISAKGWAHEVVFESGKEEAILHAHKETAARLGIYGSRRGGRTSPAGPVGEPLLFIPVSTWQSYSLQALQEMTPLIVTTEEGERQDVICVEGVIDKSMRTLELRRQSSSALEELRLNSHLHALAVRITLTGLPNASRYSAIFAEIICSGKRKEVAAKIVEEGSRSESGDGRRVRKLVHKFVQRVKLPTRDAVERAMVVEFHVDSPPKELQVEVFGVVQSQKRSIGTLQLPLMYILWEKNHGWIAFASAKWRQLLKEENKEKQEWKRNVNSLLLNGFQVPTARQADIRPVVEGEDAEEDDETDGFVPLVVNYNARRTAPLLKVELLCETAELKASREDGAEGEAETPMQRAEPEEAYKLSLFVSSFGVSLVHSERKKDLVYVLFQRVRLKMIKLPVVLDVECSLGRLQIDNQTEVPRYPVIFAPELNPGSNSNMLSMRFRTLSNNPTIQHIEICRVKVSPLRFSLDERALAKLAAMNSSGQLNSLATSVSDEANLVVHPQVLAAIYTEQSAESQMIYVDQMEISDLGVFVELELEGGKVISRNGDVLSNMLKRYVPNVVLRGLPLFLEGIHWKEVFLPYEDLRHKLVRHVTFQVAKNVLYKVLADASTTSLVNPFQQAKLVLFGAYELVNQPVQGLRDENLSGCCEGLQKGFINLFARVGNSLLELVHSASSGAVVIMNEWASVNRYDFTNRSVVLTLIVVREVSGAVRDSANEISIEVIGGRSDIHRIRAARTYSEKGALTVYGTGNLPKEQEEVKERQAAVKILAWYMRAKTGEADGRKFNQVIALARKQSLKTGNWCDRRLEWCTGNCGNFLTNLRRLSGEK